MGWNEGGRVFEQQIISLYNANVLTMDILDKIAEPFKCTDWDTGGFSELLSNDGKTAYEIICLIMRPDEYNQIMSNHPNDDNYKGENFISNEDSLSLWGQIWYKQWEIF